MKVILLPVTLALCSCYTTDFATTSRTARISGKMAAIHTWYFTGEKHVFITKIDGKEVRGTRTFTVDAGKRTFQVSVTGFKAEKGYTGGEAVITSDLGEGHVYQLASGSSDSRNTIFLNDITGGRNEVVASVALIKSD